MRMASWAGDREEVDDDRADESGAECGTGDDPDGEDDPDGAGDDPDSEDDPDGAGDDPDGEDDPESEDGSMSA